MDRHAIFLLEANRLVVFLRWAFCLLLLGAFGALGGGGWPPSRQFLVSAPVLAVAVALLFNAALFGGLRLMESGKMARQIGFLGFFQVIIDTVLVTAVFLKSGGAGDALLLLYGVPMIESIIFFEEWGPVLVAAAAGGAWSLLLAVSDPALFLQLIGQIRQTRAEGIYLRSVFFWIYAAAAIYFCFHTLARRASERVERQVRAFEKNALARSEREAVGTDSYRQARNFELEMERKRERSLEEAKSKFVAVTAHQLRTPLAAIKWTFSILAGGQFGPVNQEQKEFIEKGSASTNRMIEIVNDLLHVDASLDDQVSLVLKPVDLAKLIEQIAAEFSNQATSKQIKITVANPKQPVPPIEADPDKLRVVLENLLDNAIKYTPEKGRVEIGITDDKYNLAHNKVEVVVKDTGIGIPPAEKDKVFTKFFRASNAVSAEPDGTGAGLYVSKDIAERHGGSLWFEKREKKGMAFHLALPLKPEKEKSA